jgi:hypothetical protein
MADVKVLKDERKFKRRLFTTNGNKVETITKKPSPSPEEVEEVQAMLVVMENTLRELYDLDMQITLQIEAEDGEDEGNKEADAAFDISMKNQLKIIRAKNFVSKHTTISKTATVKASKPENTSKLPKLTLPKFNGTLTDWLSFWERFHVKVDTRTDISDVNKFDYLYGLLEGDALAAVKSLIPSSANYEVLKNTLIDNFGKNRKIVRAHVLRMLRIPRPDMKGSSSRKLTRS